MLSLGNITFAAADPARLATFWATVLGYVKQEAPPGFMDGLLAGGGDPNEAAPIIDPRGEGPRIFIRRAKKSPTIEIPIHLDVNVLDREAEVQRLLELGARLVATKTHAVGTFSETFTVMRDPEGNGFCVQGPDSRAHERPFIRNVTFACADTVALAAFWADALGYEREEPDEGFVERLLEAGLDPAELDAYVGITHPQGAQPRLLFQRREKTHTTEVPIHLDLDAENREAEVERLVELGATVVEAKERTIGPFHESWTVMKDPEGNGFCVQG